MKEILIKTFSIVAVMAIILTACAPEEESVIANQKDGLMNVMIKIPGEDQIYMAAKAGPYEDGETIIVKIPTLEEDPLNVSALKPTVSVENNCFVTPALPNMVDFTEPYEIKVVNAFGEVKTNYIEVVPTPMRTVFKSLWFKSSQDLGIVNSNISGMTVTKDYLIVRNGDEGIRLFNRNDGSYVKTLTAPYPSLNMSVKTDAGGNVIVNRYNMWGAGFRVFLYKDVKNLPDGSVGEEILEYTPSGILVGTKMSVTGDLTSGKAYIYATAENDKNIYYWEFIDGVVQSKTPTIISYDNAGSNWTLAMVKRKSIADDSDLYVSYMHYDGNDSGTQAKGSRFEILSANNQSPIQMERSNHEYKILGFETFEINNEEFLVLTTQAFWAWDGTFTRIFDITNREMIELKPGDVGYENFFLMGSDIYGGVNYNRWGDVSVFVDNFNAYIYVSVAASEPDRAGVFAYRMIYTPQ